MVVQIDNVQPALPDPDISPIVAPIRGSRSSTMISNDPNASEISSTEGELEKTDQPRRLVIVSDNEDEDDTQDESVRELIRTEKERKRHQQQEKERREREEEARRQKKLAARKRKTDSQRQHRHLNQQVRKVIELSDANTIPLGRRKSKDHEVRRIELTDESEESITSQTDAAFRLPRQWDHHAREMMFHTIKEREPVEMPKFKVTLLVNRLQVKAQNSYDFTNLASVEVFEKGECRNDVKVKDFIRKVWSTRLMTIQARYSHGPDSSSAKPERVIVTLGHISGAVLCFMDGAQMPPAVRELISDYRVAKLGNSMECTIDALMDLRIFLKGFVCAEVIFAAFKAKSITQDPDMFNQLEAVKGGLRVVDWKDDFATELEEGRPSAELRVRLVQEVRTPFLLVLKVVEDRLRYLNTDMNDPGLDV
jgi:hypothetical protein